MYLPDSAYEAAAIEGALLGALDGALDGALEGAFEGAWEGALEAWERLEATGTCSRASALSWEKDISQRESNLQLRP